VKDRRDVPGMPRSPRQRGRFRRAVRAARGYESWRLYEDARTAHLERIAQTGQGALFYLRTRNDFEPSMAAALSDRVIQVQRWWIPALVLMGSPRTIETNEPLAVPTWPTQLLVRVARAMWCALHGKRGRPLIVSYALENIDPVTWLSGRSRAGALVGSRAVRAVARRLVKTSDRVVAGTTDALTLVQEYGGTATLLDPTMPPCRCPNAEKENSVLFVGAFEERKGIRELISAWRAIERDSARGSCRLTLIGDGSLTEWLRAEMQSLRTADLVCNPPRAAVHAALRRAKVVVLLSQDTPRWREQVGLPIVEGLAHGCIVVCSDSTGMAPWLRTNGHRVLQPGGGPEQAAQAILSALQDSRRPEDVLASLPARDGRLAADAVLHA
jgi:glycosyltransferase involved in cell wall biosynthesis